MSIYPDLSIIIVHFNTSDWVKRCLSSLKKYVVSDDSLKIRVVVVDNGSEGKECQELQRIANEFSFVTLMWLPKNIGFAAGNNVAIAADTSPYVMLLNSDTEVTADSHFERLLAYMEAHPRVGVITPRVEREDGQLDWASHRGEPTPWASFTYFSGLEKLLPKNPAFTSYHLRNVDLLSTHQIAACSGAAMIVRRSAIQKVGLLDEQFFMYAEDLDWCKRFRDAGYEILYFPASVVIHHKYKSGLQNSSSVISRKTRNFFYKTMLQYFDKHYKHRYPFFVRLGLQVFIYFKKELYDPISTRI